MLTAKTGGDVTTPVELFRPLVTSQSLKILKSDWFVSVQKKVVKMSSFSLPPARPSDDGKLSFDEFKAYFSDGVLTADELKELFHTIDTHNTEWVGNLFYTQRLIESDWQMWFRKNLSTKHLKLQLAITV